MPGYKVIVRALLSIEEAAQAAVLAYVAETFPPAGEQLVRICLMSNIPYYFVYGAIEAAMQGKSKLNRS
jgi:hypothetical protein